MKTLILTTILAMSFQLATGQENAIKEGVLFSNPGSSIKIMIKAGSAVIVTFKFPDRTITGSVLSVADSLMTVSISQSPYRQIVPFRNIANLVVTGTHPKKYTVWVVLKSGDSLRGKFISAIRDSLSLYNALTHQTTHIKASSIKTIRIRKKGAMGISSGIGAGIGAVVGGIIGFAVYAPPRDCVVRHLGDCTDLGQEFYTTSGVVIGAGAGALIGLGLGSGGTEYKVEGSQTQFDLFTNKYK